MWYLTQRQRIMGKKKKKTARKRRVSSTRVKPLTVAYYGMVSPETIHIKTTQADMANYIHNIFIHTLIEKEAINLIGRKCVGLVEGYPIVRGLKGWRK